MSYEDYSLLRVAVADGVATATVEAPPVNVMSLPLFGELARLGQQVGDDETVRVLVLRSANPDFFIAHFDVEALLAMPAEDEPKRGRRNPFHEMCERYRTMPKATLAQIEGRVGGGGCELIQSFDMRFGARGRARFNQMEVPLGILPGGGGTQRLPRLVGRGRALEIILGGVDVDADLAERWGLLNRALAPDEIGPFVDGLARRIASFPPEAIALAKESVNAAERPLREGLEEEAWLFERLMRTGAARRNMQRFLELGGQTRDGELEIEALSARLQRPPG